MADIPIPRSYSQIVGEMVDALLSRLGLPALKVGSPALSIIEAAAQSDLRSSQDIFNLLNSKDLDRAEGLSLDRIGRDEQVPRIGEAPAAGRLTITDTSFTKRETRIYQGLGSPIVGTVTLNVEDAAIFPTSGSVYIGRGTTNYEGPITYASKTNLGTYWALNLSSGTTKFHNLGETVILAQGGNRTIPVGTIVNTPQGNATTSVQFATSFSATIPDGETEILGVPATARVNGTVGNAVANSVREFVTLPFVGAIVNNPAPMANGLDTEDHQHYRERIRNARQSRVKGTSLAIQTGVLGITSLDENKRVLSASVVTREDEPVSLYIDDGTGYEEQTEGVPYEVIADSAQGGEQYFQLVNGRPVAKAFARTTLQSPFTLVDSSVLAVEIGGVQTVHQFLADNFRNMANASAFEVVASVNADPNLLWHARVVDGGSRVAIFAKADTNEDIAVVVPQAGLDDANLGLGFTSGLDQTLWLYEDDRLLNKDGKLATIVTKPQSLWGPITAGATLQIEVDGIPLTITINDIDFVNAGTPYVTVAAANSLDSWVKVLNYKIPGVTVTINGGALSFTSNSGRSDRARLLIVTGAIASAMFSTTSAQGSNKDYSLDRNLGQIKLVNPLTLGKRLTAGSLATRSFVETPSFLTKTVAAEATSVALDSGAELWVVVDGAAVLVPVSIGPGTAIAVSNPSSPAWGKHVRYTALTNVFANVHYGDWLIATDVSLLQPNRGAYRVIAVDAGGLWIEIEQPASWASTQGSTALTSGGMKIVRTDAEPQRLFIPAGSNYTALSLVTTIAPQLVGGTAQVYRTQRVRLRTNTFIGGDFAVVAGNVGGVALGFPFADAQPSGISHLASIAASHGQNGTPNFTYGIVNAVTSATTFDYSAGANPSSGDIIIGQQTRSDTGGAPRYGNKNHVTTIFGRVGTTLTTRTKALQHWILDDLFYAAAPYATSARDQLAVVVDGDQVSKRYVMNMYRKVLPGSSTYGASNDFKDADNGSVSLAVAFGVNFDWKDFAVHMKARTKALGILWRYYRHGPEGNGARVQFTYPTVANQATATVTTDSRVSDWVNIQVGLRSGAPRTGYSLRPTSKMGMATTAGPVGGLYTNTYVMHLPVSTGAREIRVNYTSRGAAVFTGLVAGGTSGATATVVSDSNGAGVAASGYIVVTGPVGTFVAGETITGATGTATAAGSAFGWTTLTLTLPAGITNHGLTVGNTIWLESTNINFATGPKTLAAVTASTISYFDVLTTQGATATPGRVSNDPAGEVTLGGSAAVAGDIFHADASGNAFPSIYCQTIKTLTLSNDKFTGQTTVVNAPVATLVWGSVLSTSSVAWYPLAAGNTIANLVADVNSLTTSPITGFVYGTPTDTVLDASYEVAALGGTNPWYALTDGVNFVQSHTTPGVPATQVNFTFKDSVTAALATNSDWANEDVRLVPITSQSVVNFLNVAAVGGLFGAAEISTSARAQKPQITTLTAGSLGSIEVEGGTANHATAGIVGSAVVAGTGSVASVTKSESQGFLGGAWVSLVNSMVAPKDIITSSTAIASIGNDGWIRFDSGGGSSVAWKYSSNVGDAASVGITWEIKRQGDFVVYMAPDATVDGFASVQEGDWVYFSGGTMNSLNTGWFKVVRTASTNNMVWVENARAIEERSTADVKFFDYNSIVPGDTLVINTSLWANIGKWTVAEIDFTDQYRFRVVLDRAITPIASPIAALGTNSGLVQVYEATPMRLFKRILAISPITSTLDDIKFNTSAGYRGVGAAYGTVMTALDKFAFGIDTLTGATNALVLGADGYVHNTGLIAEANRVVYGDEANKSTYPGIGAAGANININGPIVRRVQVSFGLRVETAIVDIEDKVKSAVASVINQTPVGQSIAISELITAAQSVNGVTAITVLSPIYRSGSDLIPVQPFEKPLVIDIDQDVQVSFVGE
jgi:hypothetical protein